MERPDTIQRLPKTIDVLVPCYNEESNLASLTEQVLANCESDLAFRLIVIDDGSTDRTFNVAQRLAASNKNIIAIRFSRNFGKEAALAAGLTFCKGDAAVILDADLQHPPDIIPRLIHEWKSGAEVVDAMKVVRQRESLLKRWTALGFNRAIGKLTGMSFQGASDFKLLDKRVVEQINALPERTRFFRGLVSWVGFKHAKVNFKVQDRKQGQSKFSWGRLLLLSIDAIASHTSKPLQLTTLLGFIGLTFSLLLGVQTLYNKLYGAAVSGFTTVILVVLFMASLIMVNLGIIGLYLSKIFDEVKGRPNYIISETCSETSREIDGQKEKSV